MQRTSSPSTVDSDISAEKNVARRPADATLFARKARQKWFLVFVAPAVVLLLLTRIGPEIYSLVYSLYTYRPKLMGGDSFSGLQNYSKLGSDKEFGATFVRTLIFVVVLNPLTILISLALAVVYSQEFRFRGLLRTFIMVPSFIPVIGVTILLGSGLFSTDGLINSGLAAMNLPTQPFLSSSDQAISVIGIIVLWIGVGYWTIFLIAGLNEIPPDYYEAARIDGAGPWRRFFSITLPLLKRSLLFVMVANTVWIIEIYAPIQYLTQGGPENSTRLLMFDAVHTATELMDKPMAMAKMVVILSALITIVIVQFRYLRDRS